MATTSNTRACFTSLVIPGKVGMNMGGYAGREHGNVGIHDDVFEKICVIEQKGEYVAFASGDFIGVNLKMLHNVREGVSELTSIKPENVVLFATHTHSSYSYTRIDEENPLKKIVMYPDPTVKDFEYFDELVEKIIEGIVYCYKNLEEVTISYGFDTIDGLGSNRNNLDGYYDNSVHVIKFENLSGNVTGVITLATCHPTVLGADNYLISSDYVGYFRDKVESYYPGSTCLFIQGCAGEISTRYTRQSSGFEECERVGHLLADKVIGMMDELESVRDFMIRSICCEITFDIKNYPSDSELEHNLLDARKELDRLVEGGYSDSAIRKQFVSVQGSELTRQFKELVKVDSISSNIQLIDFESFKLVGIPGEPFGEIGRDIKELFGSHTMVAGYCNDYIGYLVSNQGLTREGYEKDMMVVSEGSHQKIIQTIKTL